MGKRSNNPDKLPVGKFFLWKSREVSVAAINTIVLGYLTIYCTDTLGMNPALVGTLLLASKAFDGVTDLFAGFLVDNTNTRWGKARPYEISVIGMWLCTVLLFSASPVWSGTIKTVWVFVMYTMVFSFFSTLLEACNTPYMIRAFSGNSKVIAKVASFGGIISTFGGVVISVSFPILMGKLATSAGGWRTLILIYALPLVVLGMLRFLFVKEDPKIDAGNSEKVRFKEIFTMLKKNKYCWIYAGIMGLYNISLGFGAGTYYFTYIIGDIQKFGIVSILSVVLLPVMFAFPVMMKKMSVSQLFVVFSVLSVVGYVTIFFGRDNFIIVLLGVLLSTLLNLPLGYLGALVIMQLATYNEYIGLPRMEGSSGIISNFTRKIGAGVGSGFAGILLGASGFISSTSKTVTQPESAMMMIRCLYSIFPAICAALIIVLSIMLAKLGKDIPKMEVEIEKRRAKVAK